MYTRPACTAPSGELEGKLLRSHADAAPTSKVLLPLVWMLSCSLLLFSGVRTRLGSSSWSLKIAILAGLSSSLVVAEKSS
eukprot:871592-Amphidinium_carterae.1